MENLTPEEKKIINNLIFTKCCDVDNLINSFQYYIKRHGAFHAFYCAIDTLEKEKSGLVEIIRKLG